MIFIARHTGLYALHAGNVYRNTYLIEKKKKTNLYMSLPKFANTFENSIYHWKGLTLAHQDVFDEFFNSFTYQNRKVRGSKGIRKIWLEIYLQIKQTQNKSRVNARGAAQSRVHFKKIFEL